LESYRVTQTGGALHPNDHRALRWIGADELADLPWVPADQEWLSDLTQSPCGDRSVTQPVVHHVHAGVAQRVDRMHQDGMTAVRTGLL
jgi:hypothetical protein